MAFAYVNGSRGDFKGVTNKLQPMTNQPMEVSCFPNIKTTTNPKNLPLPDVLQAVKDGVWKDGQDKVRKTKALWDTDPDSKEKKKAYKSAKHAMPAITISGTFSQRNNDSLLKHSSALQIDLDGDDNPNWTVEKMKETLGEDPYIYSVGVSLSGDGVKGVAVIPADAEKHLDSFLTIQGYFRDTYGLNMDDATKDVSRPCFVWYDPELIIKEIESVKVVEPIKNTSPTSFSGELTMLMGDKAPGDDAAPHHSLEDATEALRAIKDAIGKPKYEQRLYIHSGMYNSYGQAGYDAVQDVFGTDGFEKPIKELTDNHTAGTVFHMAKELRKREGTTAADFDDLEPMYHHRGKYYILDSTGTRYIDVRDGDLTRQLRARGYSAKSIDGEMSAIDKIKADIVSNHTVDAVGALAGRAIGLHQDKTTGTRHLVTRKNRRIVAKAGDCSAICGILEAQYGYQVKYIYSWLKRARYQLEKEQYMQGHVLAIAGEVGGGKSLAAQEIIQPMLGAIADAIRYLAKGNDFNADLVGSEMLLLDDPPLSRLMVDRKRFGANLKAVCAGSSSVSCHGKGVDAYNVSPLWRIVVLLNDDDDALGSFPPLGEGDSDSIGDKVLLLRCEKGELPFAGDRDQFAKLGSLIDSQLEAFAHFVDSYQIPEEIKTGDCRFGFDEYHNPRLIQTVNQNSNERTLLSVTDSCLDFVVMLVCSYWLRVP